METAPAKLLRIRLRHPCRKMVPGAFHRPPRNEKGRRTGLFRHCLGCSYCAGAVEPPDAPPLVPEEPELPEGAVGAGVVELLAGGVVGAVVAGGVVLCVVWLSVPPLSLHAARPIKAIAETDARMIFFIFHLLSMLARFPPSGRQNNGRAVFSFRHIGLRPVTASPPRKTAAGQDIARNAFRPYRSLHRN